MRLRSRPQTWRSGSNTYGLLSRIYTERERSSTWEQRIQDMEATMLLQHIQVSRQHKRGIFNFVSELWSTLFGTATAKQVRACKRQIEKARKLQ